MPKKQKAKKSPELPWIICDTREKKGFHFKKSKNCAGMIVQKLDYGDYSIKGLEHFVIIERKQTITELCNNLGKHRARFYREIERMDHVDHKFIVVEDYLSAIHNQRYTRMSASAILGSIVSLMLKHDIQVIFAGTHKNAQDISRKILIKAYQYFLEYQAEEEKAERGDWD